MKYKASLAFQLHRPSVSRSSRHGRFALDQSVKRRALARKILIAPGPLFSAKQAYRNYIRLTCALPWDERLERSLVTLGRMAGELA